MTTPHHRPRGNVLVLASLLTMALVLSFVSPASAKRKKSFYQQTNLVSDLPGLAAHTDPNLVNPWGMSRSSTSPFWVSDNGTGVTTLYDGTGQPFVPPSPPFQPIPLVVTIPPPAGSTPTGQVFNPTSDFVVTSGAASGKSFFIFATEDGTISGWNPFVPAFLSTTAIRKVDNSATGAVYKGLAIGSTASGNFLYAANFHDGTIDVFDKNFALASLAGSFSDPDIPDGFAPFNIQNLDGQLYVTYAKQDAPKRDDVAGKGNGFVTVFDTEGNFIRRIASRHKLNSPWGLALAPGDFGRFSQNLLVGNFGNGRINAFDLSTDTFRGQLRDSKGKPITIDGLWALTFGNGQTAGPTNVLFFTAGIEEEQHGLFGSLKACRRHQCEEAQ